MGTCATCGNDYANTFTITRGGKSLDFDSFECAINLVAPVCAHCGCKIIGHGVESGSDVYCCAHCASAKGASSAG